MDINFKAATPSPRMEDSVLKWFYGDVFNLQWTISLTEDGEPITYNPEDKIVFNFFTIDKKPVLEFVFTNIQDNTITLNFTQEYSNLFTPGKYTYCVKYKSISGQVTTIYANCQVEVEWCH